MKDHYKVLGLLKEADEVVIKAAYKALAQKHHPDKHQVSKAEHNKIMSDLNEAYATLGFKHKRKEYDQKLEKFQQKSRSSKAAKKSESEQTYTRGSSSHTNAYYRAPPPPPPPPQWDQSTQAKAKSVDYEEVVKDLNNNRMDEFQLVQLFEQIFNLKVQITSGHVNYYTYTVNDKQRTASFESMKRELLERLCEQPAGKDSSEQGAPFEDSEPFEHP